MIVSQIIRIASFLLPIPFMILFYIKSDKYEYLEKYSLLLIFAPIFLSLMFSDIGYNLELMLAYVVFMLFGASIFHRKGWNYPQSLSLSFCLVYFGSFLWELPSHVYTIIVRGGIDGAFPLHLLFIFPMVFVYEKVKTNQKRSDVAITLIEMIGCSAVVLVTLLVAGINIWNVKLNPMTERVIEESIWMFNRVIVVLGLFSIYANSSLRKEQKK